MPRKDCTGEASRRIEESPAGNADSSVGLTELAYSLAAGGRQPEARRILQRLKKKSKYDFVPAYNFAVIHLASQRERHGPVLSARGLSGTGLGGGWFSRSNRDSTRCGAIPAFRNFWQKADCHCKQPVTPTRTSCTTRERRFFECNDGRVSCYTAAAPRLSRHELGIASRGVAILFAAFAGDALQIAT